MSKNALVDKEIEIEKKKKKSIVEKVAAAT